MVVGQTPERSRGVQGALVSSADGRPMGSGIVCTRSTRAFRATLQGNPLGRGYPRQKDWEDMPIHFDVGGVAVKADTVSEGAELLRELLAPVKQKAKSNGSAPTNGKLKRDEVLPATLAYIGNSAKGRTTKQIAHYFAISSATASSRLQTLRSQGLINVPEKRGGYWTAA